MRVGIVILPELRWREAQHRWRRAELYGFDHGWTYDQLGWRNLIDGPWFDSLISLGAAASVTSTIRLGTHVASANFRHPVVMAREITALDDIMEGRLLLGLGAGGPSFDARVLGNPPMSRAERVDRFSEFVELLCTLLRNDRTTWKGEYYSAVDARSTPGCVQLPHVPLLVAASGRRSMAIAAEFGQGWVTGGVDADDQEAWWRTVALQAQQFDEALLNAGRSWTSMERHLSLDAGPVFSLSSVECFSDAIGRAKELGFTDVVTHWPRSSGWYAGDEAVLEAVAADVLPVVRNL